MIKLLHIPTARICIVSPYRKWTKQNVIQKIQEEGFIYLKIDHDDPDHFDLTKSPHGIYAPRINLLELEVLND